ncbi:membrane hypothetical protein [Azospirillaceae bacterium]
MFQLRLCADEGVVPKRTEQAGLVRAKVLRLEWRPIAPRAMKRGDRSVLIGFQAASGGNMTKRGGLRALAVFATAVTAALTLASPNSALAQAKSSGQTSTVVAEAPAAMVSKPRPMTDAELTSMGCIFGGVLGMGAVYAAGPSEAVMLIAGGILVPGSSMPLFLALTGTMAAASCSVGAAIAPTLMWATGVEGEQKTAARALDSNWAQVKLAAPQVAESVGDAR